MLVRLQECGGSQVCPHDRRKSTCKVGAPAAAAAAVAGVFACVRGLMLVRHSVGVGVLASGLGGGQEEKGGEKSQE